MEWWVLLVSFFGSAFGGALVTGFFAWKKRAWDREDEHSRWLRDKKQEAYVSFLENLRTVRHQVSLFVDGGMEDHGPELARTLGDAPLSLLHVLGPSDVAQKGRETADALHELVMCKLEQRNADYHRLETDYAESLVVFETAITDDLLTGRG